MGKEAPAIAFNQLVIMRSRPPESRRSWPFELAPLVSNDYRARRRDNFRLSCITFVSFVTARRYVLARYVLVIVVAMCCQLSLIKADA